MNLGTNTVASTYQYILNQSGNSPITLGDNSGVNWGAAGVVMTTGIQTIDGAKTFAFPINGSGSYAGSNIFSSIIGGQLNSISSATLSFVGGGFDNRLITSDASSIIGGRTNLIASSSDSNILGGRSNTISATINSSAIIAGNSCTVSETNCLAHGKGALAYNQGSRVHAADFFGSIGDAQYVECTLIGALARVGSGTTASTTYSGELFLDLATSKRFNIPLSKSFSGRISVLIVGLNNATASYSFPLITHRDDGTSVYALDNAVTISSVTSNESVATSSNARFISSSSSITVARTSTGFRLRFDIFAVGTPAQPSNRAIGIRAVGRVFGLECSPASTSVYY